MESTRAAAKRRILTKIERLKTINKQREMRADIILFSIEQIVINNPVSDKHDVEIREKVKTITNIRNQIQTVEDSIETLYEQLHQILRLIHE